MSEERIQKILARAGVSSRRKAEELIREGQVTINGRMAEIGDKADPGQDSIKLNGKRIQVNEPHLYLVLNKPKGVVSTLEDPEGRPTVLEFVPPQFRKAIVPVGRLDFNTEGLLLLTDDGEFAQRVSHPRYGCRKTYEVKVKGRPAETVLDRLRSGVVLDGRRTAPCRIEPRGGAKPVKRTRKKRGSGSSAEEADNASWWNVELSEGRTRQIREMFYQAGHPVQKLRRVAIGPLRDPELPVGSLRELSEREVERLLKAAKPTPKKDAAAGARKKAAAAGGEGPARPARPRKTAAQAAMAAGAAAKRAAATEGPGDAGFTTAAKRPAAPRFSQDSDGYGEHRPTGASRLPPRTTATTATTRPAKATARPGAKTAAKPGAKKAASGGRKAGGARAGAPAPRKPGTRGPRPGTPRGTRGGGGRRTRG